MRALYRRSLLWEPHIRPVHNRACGGAGRVLRGLQGGQDPARLPGAGGAGCGAQPQSPPGLDVLPLLVSRHHNNLLDTQMKNYKTL